MPIDRDLLNKMYRLNDIVQRSKQRGIERMQKGLPERVEQPVSPTALPDTPSRSILDLLREAMKNSTLVEITYKKVSGEVVVRLVEPYKVETGTNARVSAKAAGMAPGMLREVRQYGQTNPLASMFQQVLWAYDTTNPNKNGLAPKTFYLSGIESVKPTTIKFAPKWPIEGIQP